MIESFKNNVKGNNIRKLVCESLFNEEDVNEFDNRIFPNKEALDSLISQKVVYPQGFEWIFVSDIISDFDENGKAREKASIGLEHKHDLDYAALSYNIDLNNPNGIEFSLLYEFDGELREEKFANMGEFLQKYNDSEELRNLLGELPDITQREALELAVATVAEKVNSELSMSPAAESVK